MARLEITYLPGQTPLDPDEKAGLQFVLELSQAD